MAGKKGGGWATAGTLAVNAAGTLAIVAANKALFGSGLRCSRASPPRGPPGLVSHARASLRPQRWC